MPEMVTAENLRASWTPDRGRGAASLLGVDAASQAMTLFVFSAGRNNIMFNLNFWKKKPTAPLEMTIADRFALANELERLAAKLRGGTEDPGKVLAELKPILRDTGADGEALRRGIESLFSGTMPEEIRVSPSVSYKLEKEVGQ